MKKISFIIPFLFGLLFIACQEESSIVNPSSDVTPVGLNKTVDSTTALNPSDPFLLKVSKVLTLDGDNGGKVQFSYQFYDGSTVDADLTLDKGAYTGVKTFTITFDAATKSVNLDPHGTIFNIPAHLTLTYKGLNLADDLFSIDSNPSFYYFPDDSSAPVEIVYDRVIVNKPSGSLFVFNARLPHFSRFGFCR